MACGDQNMQQYLLLTRADDMFKHAFECKKCPKRNDIEGCPAWWEVVYTNPASGETRLEKNCGWSQLPKMIVEVIKASNRPAAAVESCRNEIAMGFVGVSEALRSVSTIQITERDIKLIEE